jgi:hypothetical protein
MHIQWAITKYSRKGGLRQFANQPSPAYAERFLFYVVSIRHVLREILLMQLSEGPA